VVPLGLRFGAREPPKAVLDPLPQGPANYVVDVYDTALISRG
jgi:hypothetical protein